MARSPQDWLDWIRTNLRSPERVIECSASPDWALSQLDQNLRPPSTRRALKAYLGSGSNALVGTVTGNSFTAYLYGESDLPGTSQIRPTISGGLVESGSGSRCVYTVRAHLGLLLSFTVFFLLVALSLLGTALYILASGGHPKSLGFSLLAASAFLILVTLVGAGIQIYVGRKNEDELVRRITDLLR